METKTKNVAVLAPTGVAALNIGGMTIHSFFGFPPSVTVKRALQEAKYQINDPKFTELDALVIDEISMVRADMFDCMDVFLREVRQNPEPFGGVQLVMIGDLYQLSPVVSTSEKLFFAREYRSPYFFSSAVMQSMFFSFVFLELEKVYRQSDDAFLSILNAIRTNAMLPEHLNLLRSCVVSQIGRLEEGMVYLAGTNAQVDTINEQYLDELVGKQKIFTAKTTGEIGERQFPTDGLLALKVGAQVMFVNNDPDGRWVNGSLGKVVRFHKDYIVVRLFDEEGGEEVEVTPYTWKVSSYEYDTQAHKLTTAVLGSFCQVPLTLAWAITIHKSQGKTFDKVVIDLRSGIFAHGQAYVALSRCRSLQGMQFVSEFRESHIKLDPLVVQFLEGIRK